MKRHNEGSHRNNGFEITYNEQDQKVIFSRNVSLDIRSTKDTVPSIKIIKEASGRDYMEARETAELITYQYNLSDQQLLLDNYLTTDYKNKFLDQSVKVVLYLPEGTYFRLNDNVKSFLNYYSSNRSIVSYSDANHLLLVKEDDVECLDCIEENEGSEETSLDTSNNSNTTDQDDLIEEEPVTDETEQTKDTLIESDSLNGNV